MIGADFPQFYKPVYFQNTELSQSEVKVTPGPDAEENTTSAEKKAAPLTGYGSILSVKDIHMLITRKISAADQMGYKDMLARFSSNPDYKENPQDFLKTLSPEGIRLLERVQSLPPEANVQINDLNNEEALNFILPHTKKVDLNNDGLIAGPNGAKSFQFPPPNAPASVKNAWNEATEDMSERDKMLLSGQFLGLLITANIDVDDFGVATFTQPDSPEWENPYADEEFSYREAVKKLQISNEVGKPYNTPAIYEKMRDLLATIGGAFDHYNIA